VNIPVNNVSIVWNPDAHEDTNGHVMVNGIDFATIASAVSISIDSSEERPVPVVQLTIRVNGDFEADLHGAGVQLGKICDLRLCERPSACPTCGEEHRA